MNKTVWFSSMLVTHTDGKHPSDTLFAQLIVLFRKKHNRFNVFFFSKHWVISGSMLYSIKLCQRKASVIGLTYYFYPFLSNFHNLFWHQASLIQGNSFQTLQVTPNYAEVNHYI